VRLQRAIARAWFYQTLPSVKRAVVKGRPSQVLDRLIEELQKGKDNPEAWTLAERMSEAFGSDDRPSPLELRGPAYYLSGALRGVSKE